MLGRYDSRMIGINGNASSTRQDYDPSDVAPSGAFMSRVHALPARRPAYTSDLQYYMGGHSGRWDWGSLGGTPDIPAGRGSCAPRWRRIRTFT